MVFKIALKPSFELKRACNEKKEILIAVDKTPQEIKQISNRLAKLNSQLSNLSATEYSTREKILEEVSRYCQSENLSVYNYPPSHFYDNSTFIVETNSIVIKGDYKRLLKLLNHIETRGNFSRIVSVTFFTELNRKTKSKELYLELIFQNINNNADEIK